MSEHVAVTRTRALVSGAAELFPVRVVRRFAEHGGGSQAVLIAWNALTAVFPIVLALAAIGGVLLSRLGITSDTIAREVVKPLLPTDTAAQHAALNGINSLQQQTAFFATLALLGFVWTASGLFGAMEEAFGTVFGTGGRPFLRQKLMSLLMMGIFTVLMLLSVATSALLPLLDEIPWLPTWLAGISDSTPVQVAIGVTSGFLLFFAIYQVVPNRRQRPSRVWAGALFSGVALELLTLLFPLYIHFTETGMNRYGSQFAFLFILLAFFYFLGVITMLGADLIAVLDPPRPPPIPEDSPSEERQPRMGRLRRAGYAAAGLAIGLAAGRRRG